MALKKDIEAILSKIKNQESVLFSLCWEFVLALGSIIIDHLFDTEKAPIWVWVTIIITAVFPPLIILSVKFINWMKLFFSIRSGHYSVKQYVDIFDNQISYWVMLSNSYKNLLQDDKQETDDEKAFLYCEASYYNNKSMQALYKMKSNFDKVFSENLDEVKSQGLIDLSRLVVLLKMMKSQQAELDKLVSMVDSKEIRTQIELNAKYVTILNALLEDMRKYYKGFSFTWAA